MLKVRRFLAFLFLCFVFFSPCQADELNDNNAQLFADTNSFILSPVYITAEKNKLYSTSDMDFSGKDRILHSGDLAKSFLSVAGFSMARKGGGGSEILFRSQGAARVPVFLNGGLISGGCGGRMDSGSTYIFPENYDSITILKGPQDVRFGALVSGGVLFDRQIVRLDKLSEKFDASFLYGSFNRTEMSANVLGGNAFGSLQMFASRYKSGDYKNADKQVVHSANKKESVSVIATLTPFEKTAFEFDIDLSRGFASYADRAMDARTLDRTSLNFRFNQELDFALNLIDLRVWHNTINHIMDNYSHRPNLAGDYRLSNPKRTNTGFRTELNLNATKNLAFAFGGDFNKDKHSSRSGSGTSVGASDDMAFAAPYRANYLARNLAGFVQGQYYGIEKNGLFFGARLDELKKKRYASSWSKTESLPSAFVRLEHYFDSATLYLGAGLASRGADFWELNKTGGQALRPEQNAQLDIGAVYQNRIFYLNASLFASRVKDYILIDWANSQSATALQTNATLFGGEIESEYSFLEIWHIYANLSYTYGQDLKANAPLPSIAPLQANFAFYMESKSWLVRWDLHANGAQNRYATGFGNVIGQDRGKTAGFYTMSLYGGYKHKRFSLFIGVENLTNTLYAYHLSKNSVEIDGLDNPISDKVFEPARSFWAKFKLNL